MAMHYSTRLLQRVETLEAAHREAHASLCDLLCYLASPKFREDPTVQVQDVKNRLEAAFLATIQ
jgi:hypothetical protein